MRGTAAKTASVIDPTILDRYASLARREHLLPVLVPVQYRRLVEEEVAVLGGTVGPLYKVIYPTRERLSIRAPGEVPDFVQDRDNMPPGLGGFLIRKYRDRVLMLLTEKCAGHCMYCFRQDILGSPDAGTPDFAESLGRVVEYLSHEPEVSEVILSGGDPFTVSVERLSMTLERIRSQTSVRNFRIHTRNAVFAPHTITDERCKLLREFNARLVLHIVHPYELYDEAIASIRRARAFGIRCYSQFPVLRGINDHAIVLAELLESLDQLEVRTISLFIPDPINYSVPYRMGLQRLLSIIDQLNHSTPAWINSVRLTMDTPIGKVVREDIESWHRETGRVVFKREGKPVEYCDLPVELDIPGRLEVMLWRRTSKH